MLEGELQKDLAKEYRCTIGAISGVVQRLVKDPQYFEKRRAIEEEK